MKDKNAFIESAKSLINKSKDLSKRLDKAIKKKIEDRSRKMG